MKNEFGIKRRLGVKEQKCVALSSCPDLFELENGDFAVIGMNMSNEIAPHLPSDAGIGAGEELVVIPRELLLKAKRDIPDL